LCLAAQFRRLLLGAPPAAPGERHNEDRRTAALVRHQRHHLRRAGAHVE
jgi:hypothetical protein